MLGGGGNDTFVFEFGKKTTAVVRDFHAGSDTLEIHGVNPAIDFSDLHVTSHAAVTTVDIGQDHIQLLGVSHVSASDFLFHV
jgi:Ca2+-binding RTX toxin-like protein